MEIAGRWKVLEERWPEGFARDWQSDRESAQCGCCFCRRARSSLWSQHGTGCFPFHRWRQELGQGSLQRREHGSDRCGVRSAEPERLFASLWETRRTPWSLSSGGPGSGVYRSPDGGTTWKRLEEHGLPKGPYGRLGLAVGANSERVYALIEAKEGGLYRSDDGGDTWDLVNGSHGLLQRPWYYMHIIADPQDAN